jgi:hypothetical protein
VNTQFRESFTHHTRKNYRAAYDYLASEVHNSLPVAAKILTRVKWGLIAWHLGDQCFYFYLTLYNAIIYWLKIQVTYGGDLPKTFWRIPNPLDYYRECPEPKHRSELSFHFTELSSIKGVDLVRFVQDCFRCTEGLDIYRWPLFFESGQWNYDYAWTILGKLEQIKREHARHKEPSSHCPLCQPQPLVTA